VDKWRAIEDKWLRTRLNGRLRACAGSVNFSQKRYFLWHLSHFCPTHHYLLASVYIPAQKVSSGTVRLEIIEGRISGIRIEGELDGDGTNIRVFVTHPLILEQRNRLDFTTALRFNESSEDGDLAIRDDTTEVDLLDLSLHWQPAHRNGSFSSLVGTITSNGEDNPDGLEDDAVELKATLDYSLITPFARTWFWQLRARFGYSEDPLPDIERFRLGGPGNVRAYPATEIAGDRGQLYNLDIGKRVNLSGTTNMIAKIFADYGEVERIIPFFGEEKDEELAGYGAGVLFDFGGKHSLDLEVAEPTSDLESSDDRDTRYWVNYMVQF
jgi:hemolysin activation/secretion protein